MKFFNYIFFILFLSTTYSCFRSDEFTELSPDLYFKLHSIGETKDKIKFGDYITVHIRYRTILDSVFFEGRRKLRVQGQGGPGTILPALLKMSEEDSASIKIKTSDFFKYTLNSEIPDFLTIHSFIIIDIKINEIQIKEDFDREKLLFMQWVDEYHASETQLIANYLNKENINPIPSESGLYYIPLRAGNEKKVQVGKRVWIHYTGRFLNGHFIDNSNSLTNPVDYVYGTEMFLIEGLEEALGRMHEHEKALVILPSKLGFGSYGSADQIVPPYTTLIYELEVIKVE
ncbi:MAG: FKBP-type peptidyl-prolyl cis-trans isomerase [Bacteroidales bacterium]|nr:FKBP-type peptidyl-prolyl cis-trans isomerase [Bacteroidales bacterium]